jgi:hypothetical protein
MTLAGVLPGDDITKAPAFAVIIKNTVTFVNMISRFPL